MRLPNDAEVFYIYKHIHTWAFLVVQMMAKNLPAMQETQFKPWVGRIPWRREYLPTSVFLPGEFHGEMSLVGYSLWGCKELDITEAA